MRPLSVATNLTAGSTNTIYKIPVGYYAKCVLLFANNSGTQKHITVTYYDSSASTGVDILNSYTISSHDYHAIGSSQYFVLEEGDELRITPESGSTFTSICTFELERLGA